MRDRIRWFDDCAFPALLRAARAAYGSAVRKALSGAGYDDVPRSGAFVIGAIAHTGAPLSRIIQELGVSKQAAGELVDALVTRGYLTRSVDPEDRRRLTITLTEPGRAAASVIKSAVEKMDAVVAGRVGTRRVAQTRATLAAIIESNPEANTHVHD